MGVNKAQAFEARKRGSVSCEVGYDDLPVIADDNEEDVSFSAYQNADLPADFPGELCQVSCQFMREDSDGLDFPAVKLFDSL